MQTRPITDKGADPGRFTFKPSDHEQGLLSFERVQVGMVAGVELVAHFGIDGVGWLVVTDCDCPYEEMVHLHLLGSDLQIIESRSLGGAYTAGIVEGMERLGPARFHILFPSRKHGHVITVERQTQGVFRKTASWLHVAADA